MLDEEQKREAVLIASVGGDRAMLANYLGVDQATLRESLLEDVGFGRELRRAEAACELAHLRNLQQAGRDVRQWRASVWWLERRAPDRYARREAGAVGRRELMRFLKQVAEGLAAAVRDAGDRDRVLAELARLGEHAPEPLCLPSTDAEDETEGV